MTKTISSLLVLTFALTGCPEDRPRESAEGGVSPGDAAAGPGLTDAGPSSTADGGTDASSDGGGTDASSDGGGRAALTQENLSKFMSCGAYETSLGPAAYSIDDDFDECIARCTVASSCAELEAVLCWDETADESALTRCLERCDDAPRDGFRCGDGTRIAHAYRCDFEPDCADSSDEANCGEFRCADGDVLPTASARCDYVEDCEDGSDELGCAVRCL
ncbi:MAG TPA: LDL receptor domain-containing protein [Polyangiales bacterium]